MATKSHKAKVWFIQALETSLTADRYDNFKNVDGSLRIKTNQKSWRLERKVVDRWVKTDGAFYTRTTWKEVYAIFDLFEAR